MEARHFVFMILSFFLLDKRLRAEGNHQDHKDSGVSENHSSEKVGDTHDENKDENHDHQEGHDDGHDDDHHDEHSEGDGKEGGHDEHDHSGSKEDEHAHEHEGGGKAIGDGKAITEVDEKNGFKLSLEAIATLGLKHLDVTKLPVTMPASSYVYNRNAKGFYRLRDGFYKYVEQDKDLINSYDLKTGDKIVIAGVDLLNVTGVFSTDKSEYGHSH